MLELSNITSDIRLYYIISALLFPLTYVLWKKCFGQSVVNCWFCNEDNIVAYKDRDMWTCKQCQQYNGFDKTGGYNKELPEMYDETLNVKQLAKQLPVSNEDTKQVDQEVKLCEKCSRNQLLKLKQLSQFQPINENNFDAEVKEYKNKLEHLYGLCLICQDSCQRYIKLQDTILRGSMISHLQEMKQKAATSNNIVSSKMNILEYKSRKSVVLVYQSIMLVLVLLHSVYRLQKIQWNFGMIFLHHTLYFNSIQLKVVAAGLAITSINICLLNYPFRKANLVFLCFWLHSCVMFCDFKTNFFDQLQEVVYLKSIIFYLSRSNALFWSHGIVCIVCSMFSVVIFVLALFMPSARISGSKNISKLKTKRNLKSSNYPNVKMPKLPAKHSEEPVVYSDDSRCGEDEHMDITSSDDCNVDSGLHGSLNALKLQDNERYSHFLGNFKDPNNIYFQNTLSSALNTPPPSRSSSLLSLSSHHSFKSTNPINKFGSTAHFARPSGEMPFQRYKASSNVGCWTNSPSITGHSAITSTKVNYVNHRNNSQVNGVADQYFKKPLISPAKLQWFTKDQICDGERKTCKKLNKYLASGDCDPEISMYDSVSQVGEKFYPELSDNDELPHTPVVKNTNEVLNSSSPKSSISNITSMTMQSVAEVENSRICRWILAACLLLNLVLVMLLMSEVKEMREMEQLKSKVTL